ncbi:tellurium resistance protein [Frankia sp. CcI49]|uniref:tellurite resistance TerB family protein n=1 Tax=unclassified Frankia TaxID=2632575 RepID=UPI0006CA1470|nr:MULTISPECIES: tellurite resistance TerB family protein [unclassified Frankia]KPM56782.1 tellurium resistance protein [Frankia sp. R43]ONH56937.1 tellurium resistance protein [Frankia sp. CcI49]
MPLQTQVVVDIALLVELDDGLVVRASDDGTLRFPGCIPGPGESALAAAGRLLRAMLPEQAPARPAAARPPLSTPADTADAAETGDVSGILRFAGCVEHTDHVSPEHRRKVLTVLYAVAPDPAHYRDQDDLLPDLFLLRPHEIESQATLATVQPTAVVRAALVWWSEQWASWRGHAVEDAEPWWTMLRKSVRTLRAQLTARSDVLQGEAFRDAAVAICALVAVADGRVDPAERDAMIQSIHSEPVLAAYPRAELEQIFDQHVARLRLDLAEGRRVALNEIGKVRGDSTRSWAVLHFGAVVGRADGYFDPDERRVVQEAAEVLGLSAGRLAVQAVEE